MMTTLVAPGPAAASEAAAPPLYSADRAAELQAVFTLDPAAQYRLLAAPSASEAGLLLADTLLRHVDRVVAPRVAGGTVDGLAAQAARRLHGLWPHCDGERSTYSNLRLFVDACERLLPRTADVRNFDVPAAHTLYGLVESSTLFDAAHDLRSAARQYGYGAAGEPRHLGALLSHRLIDDEALHASTVVLALAAFPVTRLPEILGFAVAMAHAAATASAGHPHVRSYRDARAGLRAALAALPPAEAARAVRGAAFFDFTLELLAEAAREAPGKVRVRAEEIFGRKARYAMLHHAQQSLGGRRLVDWFSDERFDARGMLQALGDSPWIDRADVERSRFFTALLNPGGRMFGVFSPKEIAALKAYFALPADAAHDGHGEALADWAETLVQRRDALALIAPAQRGRELGLRESFHAMLNVESRPYALAIADETVRKNLAKFEALRAAIETVALFARFDYTPAAFEQRIAAIYYHQAEQNSEVDLSFEFEALRLLHLYFSPFALVDGCWLKEAAAQRQPTEAAAILTRIFADEIGNSRHAHNHANVYRTLLSDLGWQLPEVDTLSYAMDDRIPTAAFKAPAFLLALNLRHADYLPELLGVNLAIEMSGLDGFYAAMIRDLDRHGHAADFWRLHISIDNFATGHSQQSVEAIARHLDDVRQQHGEAVMQQVWQRIWNGLMTMLYLFGIEFKVLYGARKHAPR